MPSVYLAEKIRLPGFCVAVESDPTLLHLDTRVQAQLIDFESCVLHCGPVCDHNWQQWSLLPIAMPAVVTGPRDRPRQCTRHENMNCLHDRLRQGIHRDTKWRMRWLLEGSAAAWRKQRAILQPQGPRLSLLR
jgi:hypothetical protein